MDHMQPIEQAMYEMSMHERFDWLLVGAVVLAAIIATALTYLERE